MTTAFDMPVEEYYRLRNEEGMTHHEIAKHLYVSPATLSRWKKRNGVTDLRKISDYKDLRKAKYRDFQIARHWNITTMALYLWKKSHGLVGYKP